MAPHSSTLAWKIPWTEEPGGQQSMGSLRVGHDWATSLSRFNFMHWRRKWQPTPVFLPGESQGWGSLVGCRLWGRRVGHHWSDLAAAAAATSHLWKHESISLCCVWGCLNSWSSVHLDKGQINLYSLIGLSLFLWHKRFLSLWNVYFGEDHSTVTFCELLHFFLLK